MGTPMTGRAKREVYPKTSLPTSSHKGVKWEEESRQGAEPRSLILVLFYERVFIKGHETQGLGIICRLPLKEGAGGLQDHLRLENRLLHEAVGNKSLCHDCSLQYTVPRQSRKTKSPRRLLARIVPPRSRMQANLTRGLAALGACFYYYFFPSDKQLAADSATSQFSLPLQKATSYRGSKELTHAGDKALSPHTGVRLFSPAFEKPCSHLVLHTCSYHS